MSHRAFECATGKPVRGVFVTAPDANDGNTAAVTQNERHHRRQDVDDAGKGVTWMDAKWMQT
jgi:hypothetical protein